MQTAYGAQSYQTPTSRNCKLFKTQLCALLLAAHKTQTLSTCMTNVLPIDTHFKFHVTQLKELTNTNTPFTLL